MANPFNVHKINLSNGSVLVVVDIEKLEEIHSQHLDKHFVKICEGNSGTSLAQVKVRVKRFLEPKKDTFNEIGAIAEFFLHVVLNDLDFSPQFLFLNLEENSLKKGFDGYYVYRDNEWIFESKSGLISTTDISHKAKVKESYNDLKEKLAGNTPNNPWREAYNHAKHGDVNSEQNIVKNIKKFTDEFESGITHKIENFNIIPSSTIFLEGSWAASDVPKITSDIESILPSLKATQLMIICITKKCKSLFWDYLDKP